MPLLHTLGEAAGNSSSEWGPATHVGDVAWAPASRIPPGPAQAVAGIQEGERQMGRLCFFLCFSPSSFQVGETQTFKILKRKKRFETGHELTGK